MPAKCVFGWSFQDTGAKRPGMSEVHYYMPAVTATDEPGIVADAAALMNSRTQLMGSNVRATVMRLSLPGVRNSCNTIYAEPNASGSQIIAPGPAISQGFSDIPDTSMRVWLMTANNQRSIVYMAGVPDSLIKTGGVVGPDFAAAGLNGYQALWNNYLLLLLGGKWGSKYLLALPPGQPQEIAFWDQSPDAPYNLRFMLPKTAAYKPAAGEIVHVRGVLMGVTGAPRPIGNWKIRSTTDFDADTLAYTLDQSSGYQAVLIQINGTVEQVMREYAPYKKATNLGQGRHARGVGPVRPRGRSKPRVRRQPV